MDMSYCWIAGLLIAYTACEREEMCDVHIIIVIIFSNIISNYCDMYHIMTMIMYIYRYIYQFFFAIFSRGVLADL